MSRFRDWADTLARTAGVAKAEQDADGKATWICLACVTAPCPAKVVVPFSPEVFRSPRALRRALLEHEGDVYRKNGGWTVQGLHLERTFMTAVDGFGALCPACTDALEQRRHENAVRSLMRRLPGAGGRGST